jgi:small-conductance mechanosensitive channel
VAWQTQALQTLLVLVLTVLARWLVIRSLRRRVDDARLRYRLRGVTSYVLAAIAVLAIGTIWLEGIEGAQLATYLGFLTAGLAIALRDPLVNLVAWLYITATRPFRVGDRIEIAGLRGDVVGQNPFAFQMLELGLEQSTGRVVSTPNALIFTQSLVNATLEFAYIWLEIPVVVTFESQWRPLREVLLELADKHAGARVAEAQQALRESSRLMVDYGKLTPTVYTKAVDHGVQVTLRCLVATRTRRMVEDAIWRDLLGIFEQDPTLDLAYPTQRFYDRKVEGAPDSAASVAPAAPGVTPTDTS